MPAEPGGIGQQRGEPLHPPVDRDVVDLDTALEEQASELEASIRARELDNARRGGDATRAGPTHRDRIEKEREFLRRIQKRLSGS